jgi:hypothetical protein
MTRKHRKRKEEEEKKPHQHNEVVKVYDADFDSEEAPLPWVRNPPHPRAKTNNDAVQRPVPPLPPHHHLIEVPDPPPPDDDDDVPPLVENFEEPQAAEGPPRPAPPPPPVLNAEGVAFDAEEVAFPELIRRRHVVRRDFGAFGRALRAMQNEARQDDRDEEEHPPVQIDAAVPVAPPPDVDPALKQHMADVGAVDEDEYALLMARGFGLM